MKIKILLILWLSFPFVSNAQNNKPKAGSNTSHNNNIKAPKGFSYIPGEANKPEKPGFFVMIEPVNLAEYKEFINTLNNEFRIIDANNCLAAMPKVHNYGDQYAIVANPNPIALYAEYLSRKYSDSLGVAHCHLVTEKELKQMKAPEDGKGYSGKHPYNLVFKEGLYEWRQNNKGEFETYTDVVGNTQSAFRLVMIKNK